ncbi:G-protein coupled receptor family C group 5 member C-like [Eucyclogobius newberryi]|uniref:G-protein coupled receptor family C group 5 member C-like n=1 Tax=Eucyclogobius newberryi TaxID=166745 RepID=UPI003B5AFC2C
MSSAGPPKGCGPDISSVYYNLCDLTTVWGIAVEAVAAGGVVTAFILFVTLMGSLPFVSDKKRKGTVALQAGVLIFTLGLFGLTFAFVVSKYPTTCSARRFLFGVLFSGCLACLVMHGLWLALLDRRDKAPRSWVLCLGALGLWLVEVIINTEWLILTVVRNPIKDSLDLSCFITNADFAMSLVYVMVLLLAVVAMAAPSLRHKHKQWRSDGASILLTGLLTLAIWVAWIVIFLYGNGAVGDSTWDDPTLAVAVVSNAWVFLFSYTIPEICLLTRPDPDQEQPPDGEHVYPARSLVYDNVIKEADEPAQSRENNAFSMDESPETSISPYAAFNGPLRNAIYQPTELALIAKSLSVMEQEFKIPRANTPSLNPESSSLSLPSQS